MIAKLMGSVAQLDETERVRTRTGVGRGKAVGAPAQGARGWNMRTSTRFLTERSLVQSQPDPISFALVPGR